MNAAAQLERAPLPAAFLREVERLIPVERRFDDPLSTLAFGTDASFYRLVPKLVVRVETEAEVVRLLKLAHAENVPVTFRAAGTSLSGQAISDSVLIVLGDNWNGREIRNGGEQIRLQPGVIGANANAVLAPFQRKIGPDPASINAAKIGGIVANNSSGMCCGTAQNSYKTLAGLRVVLADGTVVDSEDAASVAAFRQSHAALLEQLAELGRETRANAELAAKIRHKYRLKNTTGFSLNALVDYDEPLDILNHLMVGSEGTLGFISAVTYDTVPDHPHKASALVVFPDVENCCLAVPVLKQQPVSAVELLDRRSLRSVEHKAGMPEWVKELSPTACALLIESRAASQSLLHEQVNLIMASIAHFPVEKQVDFSEDPVVYNQLWKIRKDTFPAVGAVRQTGTTVIIEDVTFLSSAWPKASIGSSSCSTSTATTRRSSSATPWKATCTSSSPRASTIRRRSPVTRPSWAKWRSWLPSSSAARSRPSTAPGATWRPSSSWNGAARPMRLCGRSSACSTPPASSIRTWCSPKTRTST